MEAENIAACRALSNQPSTRAMGYQKACTQRTEEAAQQVTSNSHTLKKTHELKTKTKTTNTFTLNRFDTPLLNVVLFIGHQKKSVSANYVHLFALYFHVKISIQDKLCYHLKEKALVD